MLDAKNVNYYFNGHFPTYGSTSNIINNVYVMQEETMHLLHVSLILNSCQYRKVGKKDEDRKDHRKGKKKTNLTSLSRR